MAVFDEQIVSQPMSKLFIIPCCARKDSGGRRVNTYEDRLVEFVSPGIQENVLAARADVLAGLRSEQKYLSGKYAKNENIQDGPDVGGTSAKGVYLLAIDRYIGSLYTGNPKLVAAIRENEASNSDVRVLILSALYGPLHPLDLIQDYNLQMSDKPAYRVWKDQFPLFLEQYVDKNQVSEISLYVGGSTRYFRVAELAARRLKQKDLVGSVTQYEVIDGSSFVTPFTHGQLLYSHLSNVPNRDLKSSFLARQI